MNFNSKHCLMFLSIFMVMSNLITASITIRKCASELELDTCLLKSYSKDNDIDITTEYYGKCKSGKRCDRIEDSNYAYQCVSPKRKLKLDEDCVVNEECESKVCKDKKCSYLNTDAPCTSSVQCGDGSYCRDLANSNDGVCTKYSMENEKCEYDDDYQCIPYLACGKDNKCVKKYSQEDGTQTEDSDACQSGVSVNFGSGEVCVNEVKLTGECSSDQDKCTLTYKSGTNEKIDDTIECVYKSDGKTLTCDSYKGSDEQKKYIQLYKEKYDELEEEDFEEITNYVTLDSKDILEAYVMYAHRVELLDAEECLIEAYISKQASQGIISLKKILLIGLIALLI